MNSPASGEYQTAIRLALGSLGCGNEDDVIARVESLLSAHPGEADGWQALGLLYRAAERTVEALSAFERAVALAPQDGRIANGLAQVRLEGGLDAVAAFETALQLAPEAQTVQGLAAARVAIGDWTGAITLLDTTLAANPLWGEGHWLLSRLRWMSGEGGDHLAALNRELRAQPRDPALWQIRVAIEQRTLAFAPLLKTIAEARAWIGDKGFLASAEAAALSELGRIAEAESLFVRLAQPGDVTEAVYRLRHALRCHRVEQAARLAEQALGGGQDHHYWPYLALAWRCLDDPRWEWLEGQCELVGTYDIGSAVASLPKLAETLRRIHAVSAEPLEQSVRGGSQTDGPLFARLEPEIADLRRAIAAAVTQHLDRLPPPDVRHPQLGLRRDRAVRFAGAWSVRLTGGGHHVGHIHPEGWFSSACYIALPTSAAMGDPPAGHLVLGVPDKALGLDLPPIRVIAPKQGALVLFPSTMWHSVEPFAAGERLSVAFDVCRPAQSA
ncbi:MAG: putative 2OG-Fe(II) oxygenase [Burkholderiales bacterium]